ncbi:hypothetical protein Poli38472_003897 [Pythium oligandrum]|uniref:Transmembrane protein n=1 Tax=Pythium oligandrum TaxID=41045 RepID=A0A8K1CPB2_PYTOL|nr:hypothetical protein Poli38472_003897 [Pythium oligandrum]|eukprot:TMW66132.1 hypothetical protein Poli38472_003897 [Pythium oligandrum]
MESAVHAIRRSGTHNTYRVNEAPVSTGNKYRAKQKQANAIGQFLHLLHRAAIFAIALRCTILAFSATHEAMVLLGGDTGLDTRDVYTFKYPLVSRYAGTESIRQSPLVLKTLGGDTTPLVEKSLYLREEGASFIPCDMLDDTTQGELFSDSFMRTLYASIAQDTGYHITSLTTVELIAPIVDCAMSDKSGQDGTNARFFFLVRELANHDQVHLVVVSLSNQQYSIPAQVELGPAGVASIQVIQSMQEASIQSYFIVSIGFPMKHLAFRGCQYIDTTEDGQWQLQTVPSSTKEMPKMLLTSFRAGFFMKGEAEQSNINNMIWTIPTDPKDAIGNWKWVTTPVVHDTWAWVHFVQLVIGIRLLSSLLVLVITAYQNFRRGKLWLGDAFVSICSSQLINGAAVLISWLISGAWSLHEFAYHMGYKMAGVFDLVMFEAPMYADVLTLYLCACGIIGSVFRERIDPFLALICFELGYGLRIELLDLVPSLRDQIIEHATTFFQNGNNRLYPEQAKISPMSLWMPHPITKKDVSFVAACLAPIFFTPIIILVYVLARKVYAHFYPDSLKNQRNTTGTANSANDDSLLSQKRVLTLFEVATGAELENRFGLVADYENCRFIKGMKYASADGIYSNGFVIANQKYLVQTDDFWTIVLMKLIRARFTNIYVFEVNGNTVQPTARLVYAHTLSMSDLMSLNVSVLS